MLVLRGPKHFQDVGDVRDTFFNYKDGYYNLIGGQRYFIHIGEAAPKADVKRIAKQIAKHFKS